MKLQGAFKTFRVNLGFRWKQESGWQDTRLHYRPQTSDTPLEIKDETTELTELYTKDTKKKKTTRLLQERKGFYNCCAISK